MKIVKSDVKVMLTRKEVMDAIAYWLLVAKGQDISVVSVKEINDPSEYDLDSSYTNGLVLKVFENE